MICTLFITKIHLIIVQLFLYLHIFLGKVATNAKSEMTRTGGHRYRNDSQNKNTLNPNVNGNANQKHNNRYNERHTNWKRRDGSNRTGQGSHRYSNGNQGNNDAPSNHAPTFSANRKFFDRKVKTGEAFQRPQDGARFLDASVEFEDKVDLLGKLTTEYGQKMLRLAITDNGSDSVTFLRDHVIPFIKVLGCDELNSGMRLRSVLEVVKVLYETPGFVSNLLSKYKKSDKHNFCSSLLDGKIDKSVLNDPERNEEEFVMGWFVLKCCTEIEKGENLHVNHNSS